MLWDVLCPHVGHFVSHMWDILCPTPQLQLLSNTATFSDCNMLSAEEHREFLAAQRALVGSYVFTQ